MNPLPHLSLQAKLTAMLMLTTGIALVGACAAFVVNELFTFRKNLAVEIATLAEITARDCAIPVMFDRKEEAELTLAHLDIARRILAAWVYRQGTLFAKHPKTLPDTALPAAPPATNSHAFGPNTLTVARPIPWPEGGPLFDENGRPLEAVVVVKVSLADMYARLGRYAGIAAIVAVVAAAVAYLIGARLRGLIARPILELSRTAQAVSEHKDYSRRAAAQGQDEVGRLVTSFNEMLAQIQRRDHELQEARNTAERANQAKSAFLSFMSHELRTPLTAINGFSEMLIADLETAGRPEWVDDLRRIHDSGNYLLELINDILDLSKIEAGKMEVHVESIDVGRLVRELGHVLRPLVEHKRNRLVIACPDDLGTLQADLIKVRQCLLNLLSNANKFTEQGTLTLQAERTDRAGMPWLTFRVRDTGIGMTPDQIQKLFHVFTQASERTSRKYGGTGLGLALTKQFVTMMGGEIDVQSQVGEGSTFTLHLPALSTLSPPHAPPATAPAAAAPPMSHAPAATQVVLAIDDDPAVHAFLRDALASENWRLAFAASGTEGLRLARELKPDVITLDVLMPEMDGWVVLSLLKTDPQLAPIPVIMLTVKEQQDFAFAMGVADYLQKPIDRDRLVAVLRKHRRLDPPVQVLVVEDDPHMRDMLRRMLERDDWRVAEAENGLVALEQISRSLPSLIVLDLMMPVMDGFQMVAELQKHETWRRIPIVIVSAKELTPDDRRRLQGHVRAILQKGSFRRSDLMREIQHTVRVFLASPPPSTEGGPPPAAPPAQRRANLEP